MSNILPDALLRKYCEDNGVMYLAYTAVGSLRDDFISLNIGISVDTASVLKSELEYLTKGMPLPKTLFDTFLMSSGIYCEPTNIVVDVQRFREVQ